MNSDAIKYELELMDQNLLQKGCIRPENYLTINPNAQFRGHVGYHPDNGAVQIWKFFYGDSTERVIAEMRTFCDQVATKEDRQRQEYLKKLADTIEYGKAIGLDEDFINPLALQMKKLSANIIEHQPQYDAPKPSRRELNDDIPF